MPLTRASRSVVRVRPQVISAAAWMSSTVTPKSAGGLRFRLPGPEPEQFVKRAAAGDAARCWLDVEGAAGSVAR